jgi:hypothetical protein
MTDPVHTPLPWWIDDDGFIAAGSGDDYQTVADPHCRPTADYGDENGANAAFIIRACNSHYQLLDTLDFVRSWFVDNDLDGEYHAIFEEICAAVAKVRRPQ